MSNGCAPKGGDATTWDYATIKTVAKAEGCRVTDLIAMKTDHDPFYAGMPGQMKWAEWFAAVWERGGFQAGTHLRRMHYWCVSQPDLRKPNGIRYENTEDDWKKLQEASKPARYLGLVDVNDFVDRKNPAPRLHVEYGYDPTAVDVYPPEITAPEIYIGGFNPSNVQPYHLEVLCEKSTMNDVLIPLCKTYGANLVTGEGDISITFCNELAKRLREANKPARLFFVSDFDPTGRHMPTAVARKLEFFLQDDGMDVRLYPLALTAEQAREYELPRSPIKGSDRGKGAFEEAFGEGATELDALEALHPGSLAEIVGAALSDYYDDEAAAEAREIQQELQDVVDAAVDEITERYGPQIEALETMQDELRQIEVPDLGSFEPVPAEPDADDTSRAWLFDSGREYREQMGAYRRYKRGGEASQESQGDHE